MNFQFYNFTIFKRIISCLVFFVGFLLWGNAMAAEHYVRADATGNNDGSDWTNAHNVLPVALVRGDTYYIADGNYIAYTFNDAEVGSEYIYIKKATSSSHGTDTGWNSAYGDGQVIWTTIASSVYSTGINFLTGYYVFDGIEGSGNNISSYGFKIIPDQTDKKIYLLGIPMLGSSNYQVDHVTVSHIALVNAEKQIDDTLTHIGLYSYGAAENRSSNITVSNNYFANNSASMLFVNGEYWHIHDNYFDSNWSSPTNHGDQISPTKTSYVWLYNNYFHDSAIYVIGAHNDGTPGAPGIGNDHWYGYDNIIDGYNTDYGANSLCGFGMAESAEINGLNYSEFHHNTFINVSFSGYGAVFAGHMTDKDTQKVYAYNNLFFNCVSPRMNNGDYSDSTLIHDNSAYLSCTGTINSDDETAPQRDDAAADPFVDSVNGNYNLKIGTLPINNGKTGLGATYAYDYAGTERGASPDIGAYEYIGAADTVAPAAPSGLAVQ